MSEDACCCKSQNSRTRPVSPPGLRLDKAEADFRQKVKTAFELTRLMPSQSDQRLSLFWLKRLLEVRSDVPAVRRGRADFLEYLLGVLRDAVYAAALGTTRGQHLTPRARLKLKEELRHLGECGHHTYLVDRVLRSGGPEYMCRWSEDRRTYVAVKPLPGRGALVYMAATDSPEDGWDMPLQQPPDFISSTFASL